MPQLRYSLNSSTIKPLPILQKIAIAAEAGYSAIELWHDDIYAHLETGGTLADIRKATEDHGLIVPTSIMLKGWLAPDGPELEVGLEECKRRLHQAAEVGAIYAVAGPPLGAVDRTLAGQRYRELLQLGRSFGVKPAMEYLGFAEDINTIEDAMQIMAGADDADATIVLDPFHCFRGGGSMETISQLNGSQIAISHFNDAPASPPREQQHDLDRVMPGDGIVDLKRYVGLLKGTGFDGFVSLELFRRDLWEGDPREVARIGLEKMRAVVEG